MAGYKVIQDIEAEDKFLGPLTLKQFIFAGITAVCLYISFIFITRGIWFLVLPLLPVMGAGGFLAFPWGRDQPTEVWLLGKLRFFIKPRRRVWDQSGVEELVTITAPKREEVQYTNNLSQSEVKSRLRALADTIDSRGWAVKNVNTNLYIQPSSAMIASQFSDRLVDVSSLPQEVPNTEVLASDDILDPQNNSTAQHLDEMITSSTHSHREAALQHMQQVRDDLANPEPSSPGLGAPAPNYWFINQPVPAQLPPVMSTSAVEAPVTTPAKRSRSKKGTELLSAEEQALLDQLHKEQSREVPHSYGHMKVIQPLSAQGADNTQSSVDRNQLDQTVDSSLQTTDNTQQDAAAATTNLPAQPAAPPVTQAPDPAILDLAINNDRDVASLAREAQAKLGKQSNEIVINLR